MKPSARVLSQDRVASAKRAFTTRRLDSSAMRYLIEGVVKPESGDLVLARIDRLGRQKKIELTDGRKSQLFPGDEVIVAYGNRYAPDQYEAVIGPDLSSCGLVASGGVAGQEIARHLRVLPATGITPIGLIGGADGRRLNLRDFCVETVVRAPSIPVVLSLGTSMNAGKTLTSMSLVRGFKRAGLRVAVAEGDRHRVGRRRLDHEGRGRGLRARLHGRGLPEHLPCVDSRARIGVLAPRVRGGGPRLQHRRRRDRGRLAAT